MDPRCDIKIMDVLEQKVLRHNFIKPMCVHSTILEWFKGFLSLFEHLKYDINEIFHHQLDGDLYCFRFASDFLADFITVPDRILQLKHLTRFKMPWKAKPTYFLRKDSKFNEIKNKIMTTIRTKHLLPLLIKTYELVVNFIFIPSIEVYEFSNRISAQQTKQLNKIFDKLSMAEVSLYITDELPWHELFGDFIEIDTLALDICGEEWKRYDLLNGFQVEQILSIDLANKDYREPYCDSYLDLYLTRLITRRIPNFDSYHNNKTEFYFSETITRTIGYYFIHMYYNRISKIYVHDLITKQEFDYITTIYDIPIEIIFSLKLDLSGEVPHPDSLLEISPKYKRVDYKISNYKHLNDRVFRQLLNFPNHHQSYTFDLSSDFYFEVPAIDTISPIVVPDQIAKNFKIILTDCNERNVIKFKNFVQYIVKLFSGLAMTGDWLSLKIKFIKCHPEFDYVKTFENIASAFKSVTFDSMIFSSEQRTQLGLAFLSNTRQLIFKDCELSDTDVTQLTLWVSDDTTPSSVIIGGANSCTYLVYFMVARLFIEANGMQPLNGHTLPVINNLADKEHLSELMFCIEYDTIVVRKIGSNHLVDFYCFMNGIAEDEPPLFDYD